MSDIYYVLVAIYLFIASKGLVGSYDGDPVYKTKRKLLVGSAVALLVSIVEHILFCFF